MNNIKQKVREINDNELKKELINIENKSSDESKYYEAARVLQRKERKQHPKIINKEGKIASSDKKKCKIITDFFTELLQRDEIEEQKEYHPVEMEIPFTQKEISKIVKRLKDNKRAGPDEVKAELIKNSPKEVHETIAKILQLTSKGNPYPEVLRKGTLIPLSKPPKNDAKVNVRPIILLSILRKIISMCMIDRCWTRLKGEIPIEQAAYQLGRSTTEQVFCVKTLAEKAITTSDYTIYILMLDMSKAFDSINRKKLLIYLSEILTESEMYIMNLLINDVIINVHFGEEKGENIFTNDHAKEIVSRQYSLLYISQNQLNHYLQL